MDDAKANGAAVGKGAWRMGDFDTHIAWLRSRQAIAEQDIQDYMAGATHLIGGMDFTESFVARAQSDIKEFKALIAVCEAHNR